MLQHKEPSPSNKQLLAKYAGLATQLMVSLGLGVFLGYHTDKWLSFRFPIFIWILPLTILMVIFYRVLKDTSKK
jgi:F0F1-type ATP synthase assembly protein I